MEDIITGFVEGILKTVCEFLNQLFSLLADLFGGL